MSRAEKYDNLAISQLNKNKNIDFMKCEPVCRCLPRVPVPNSKFEDLRPFLHKNMVTCRCGDPSKMEWLWDNRVKSSSVKISPDRQQVLFHPTYSNGTALVKGDSPFKRDYQHYWEIKVLSECYGTDIMVGLGSDVFNNYGSEYKFRSLLGCNTESYGMSYLGGICHDQRIYTEIRGFNIGDIVGVKLDLWQGTLQYYVNRKVQEVAFFNMRRHKKLLPMISSTAAQSTFRLVFTSSWKASLMTDAAKILASMIITEKDKLPIGIQRQMEGNFWILYPDSCRQETDYEVLVRPNLPLTDQEFLNERQIFDAVFENEVLRNRFIWEGIIGDEDDDDSDSNHST